MYTDSDPKNNQVPESHQGYLPRFLRYGDLVGDFKQMSESFASDCHKNKLTLFLAERKWEDHCRGLIKKQDTEREAVLRAQDEQIGSDDRYTPEEAEMIYNQTLKDPKAAFNVQTHPNHEFAVSYMNRLQEIRFGVRPTGEDGRADMSGYLVEVKADRRDRQRISAPHSASNGVTEPVLWGTAHDSPKESNIGDGSLRSAASGAGIQ